MPEYYSQMASLISQMFGKTSNGLPFFCDMLMLLFISATCMSIVLVGFSEVQRAIHRKVFHEKYTLQLIEITVFICTISFLFQSSLFLMNSPVTLSGAGIYILEFFKNQENQLSLLSTFSPRLILFFFTLVLLFLLISSCFIWKKAKKSLYLRLLILIPSILLATTSLFWSFTLFFPVQELFIPFTQQLINTENKFILFFTSSPFIVPAFLWLTITGLVIATFFWGIWLILRRNRVDFGRDYYTFAMQSFARMTLGSLLLCLLSLGLLAYTFIVSTQGVLQTEAIRYLSMYTSVLVLITILLSRIALSQTPMRYKLRVFFSFLFFFIASFLPVLSIFLIFSA